MPSNPYYRSAHWAALRQQALKRDHYTCTTPGCGQPAIVADHIKTRPNVPHSTPLDTLGNLRSLCRACDNQVKEIGGKRKGGGTPRTRGCGPDGMPADPSHPWFR